MGCRAKHRRINKLLPSQQMWRPRRLPLIRIMRYAFGREKKWMNKNGANAIIERLCLGEAIFWSLSRKRNESVWSAGWGLRLIWPHTTHGHAEADWPIVQFQPINSRSLGRSIALHTKSMETLCVYLSQAFYAQRFALLPICVFALHAMCVIFFVTESPCLAFGHLIFWCLFAIRYIQDIYPHMRWRTQLNFIKQKKVK